MQRIFRGTIRGKEKGSPPQAGEVENRRLSFLAEVGVPRGRRYLLTWTARTADAPAV